MPPMESECNRFFFFFFNGNFQTYTKSEWYNGSHISSNLKSTFCHSCCLYALLIYFFSISWNISKQITDILSFHAQIFKNVYLIHKSHNTIMLHAAHFTVISSQCLILSMYLIFHACLKIIIFVCLNQSTHCL